MIVRSKLSRCGNPNNWDSQDKSNCNTCFGVDSGDGSVDESTTLCSNYRSYIYGVLQRWKEDFKRLIII